MNVLLISLDTTRADHLGCYGWRRNTSPHLDRLAESGTLFENCFSPWIPTHPAHTTMLTGHDVMRHQIVAQGGKAQLADEIPLLQERLKQRGWFTAAADNLARWFSRGFDLYEGYRWASDGGAWRKGEAVADTAVRVLNQAAAQEKPFFLFVHFWDPHTPYLPPPPFSRLFYQGYETDPACDTLSAALNFPPFMHYFRQWMGDVRDAEFPRAQYDAAIAYMDCCVQRLLQRLEELGLRDRTLVIVTADHGEQLGEHDIWFDHHGLYDTNLRVPLIISMPGSVPAGRRVQGTVCLADLTPTILAITGMETADPLEGRSLAPLLAGPADRGTWEALPLTECTWMRKRGLRTNDWKLIVAREPDIHDFPPLELYDLRNDPGETRNLAAERSEVVARLKTELFGWIERRMRETGLPDPIEEQEITLRQIGAPKPEAVTSTA